MVWQSTQYYSVDVCRNTRSCDIAGRGSTWCAAIDWRYLTMVKSRRKPLRRQYRLRCRTSRVCSGHRRSRGRTRSAVATGRAAVATGPAYYVRSTGIGRTVHSTGRRRLSLGHCWSSVVATAWYACFAALAAAWSLEVALCRVGKDQSESA
jgi:hypothetical protein